MIWLLRSLTLVFCLGPGSTVSKSCANPRMTVNGVLGESVTLPLEFPAEEKITSITWLHNGTSITFIQLKETGSPHIHTTDPKRRERLNFTPSYSLQLSNLTMEDTGCYHAQKTSETSAKISFYTLRIFGLLKNLKITHSTALSENKTCKINLTCSVENPNDSVSFTWQPLGKLGPDLTISWNPENSNEQNYICIAKNPVSNLSSSLSASSLCKADPENLATNVMGIVMPVILTIIFTFMCLLIWMMKKAGVCCFSAPQTQHSAETTGNTEWAFMSPGNTVYTQVYHTKQNTSLRKPRENKNPTTIYSTVQQPKEKSASSRVPALDNIIYVVERPQRN